MSLVKIGIVGCLGRMGLVLTAETLNHKETVLVGGTEMPGNPKIDQLIRHPHTGEETSTKISSDTESIFKNSDVVFDFTCPTATVMHSSLASKHGTKLVIGTTGLSPEDVEAIKLASKKTAIIYASNYSLGINLLFHLTRKAASILGEDFDIEIHETHHRYKVDAPSGTALSLGQEAAVGRNKKFEDIKRDTYYGINHSREKGTIGFSSSRGGNVAGDHIVSFMADDERVELAHKATNRSIFARGALHAAIWINNKQAGLYDMGDVLGLNDE